MTLTLREKLSGYHIFQSFVSPHTDRTLKPFIYRDSVMKPPWMQLMEEIEHFKRNKLKTSPFLKLKMDILHDHNYFGSRETIPERYFEFHANERATSEIWKEEAGSSNNSKDVNSSGGEIIPERHVPTPLQDNTGKKVFISNISILVEERSKTKKESSKPSSRKNNIEKSEKLNEDKSASVDLRPCDISLVEHDNMIEEEIEKEIEKEPSDDRNTIDIEGSTNEKTKERKGNEDKAQGECEGNVFKNKADKRKGVDMIRENFRTKDKLLFGRTIDFCYVREEHIRAINTLAEELFWPNISMKECMLYPEFTVVALCRKLIVGLGAMVPNPSKPNETYITFLATRRHWRTAGIGSFMLYHLIATCQSTHITLHCSVSRHEALGLYFKFGFKVQCVVLNFYKPYLSSHPSVDMSPHAYYLKYSRNVN